jgi:uncharacterized protein DUF3300
MIWFGEPLSLPDSLNSASEKAQTTHAGVRIRCPRKEIGAWTAASTSTSQASRPRPWRRNSAAEMPSRTLEMRPKYFGNMLAMAISSILIATPLYSDQPTNSPGGAADVAPMNTSELRALVAPIALYPDPLVAQILSAATFPDQVAVANYWLQQHRGLAGHALIQTVNAQLWDASVKALTQFPSVLENLANNLSWTSSLGEAYHGQPAGVMAAIQALRAQAKREGHLQSGPQITVSQASPQTITIEPANPQVVYVPQYDPAAIYGIPYATPGYTWQGVAGSLLGFGAGVAVGSLAGGCCGGGWGSWGCNWAGGAVVYNHNNFYGNPAWHGGYYNGALRDGYGYDNPYTRAIANDRGFANREQDLNRMENRNLASKPEMGSWAHANDSFRGLNAFGGFGDRFGGWQSRAESFRGWGSMRAGGFGGGRFGGGRFGGGRFGGFHGGFRR